MYIGCVSCLGFLEDNKVSVTVKAINIPIEKNSRNSTSDKNTVGRVIPTRKNQNKQINHLSVDGVNGVIRSRLVGKVDREKGVHRYIYDKCDQKREINKSDSGFFR